MKEAVILLQYNKHVWEMKFNDFRQAVEDLHKTGGFMWNKEHKRWIAYKLGFVDMLKKYGYEITEIEKSDEKLQIHTGKKVYAWAGSTGVSMSYAGSIRKIRKTTPKFLR